MERLTPAEAHAALLALGENPEVVTAEVLSDPRAALDSALRDLIDGGADDLSHDTVSKTIEILRGLVAHLDFEAGRAFELAAVEKARFRLWGEEPTIAGGEALSKLGAHLRDGLHHAEEP